MCFPLKSCRYMTEDALYAITSELAQTIERLELHNLYNVSNFAFESLTRTYTTCNSQPLPLQPP